MSTTIRELLELATGAVDRAAPDADLPLTAAAVIGHCGRALVELGFEGPNGIGSRRKHAAVMRLADDCRTVSSTWPGGAGRAESLGGAAADAVARRTASLLPDGRWALAVAVAETARRCADHAQDFPPCEGVPQLTAVHICAADVELVAAMDPPTPFGRTALDHAVPSPRPSAALSGHAAVAEAAPALAAAVRTQAARGTLTVRELLATVAAAEAATSHAVAVADALKSASEVDGTWAATPATWRAVHVACAPFDDGTKSWPRGLSEVILWAVRLEDAVHSLGRVQPADTDDIARAATAMRAVTNQVPDIAYDLGRAVARWSRHDYVLARERRLVSYEDRNLDAASATNRVVVARGHDLDDLALAVSNAHLLSMSLASELDRTSESVGFQPHPARAAVHSAETRSVGELALHVRAERAQARIGATVGVRQWSFAPRSPGPGRSR